MQKLQITSVFLIFTFLIQGQSIGIEISSGELVKENFKEISIINIPDESGGLFEIKYRKKQYFIRHYNTDLKIDSEYIHQVDKERIAKIFVLNKKLHFIELVGNRSSKKAIFKIFTQNNDAVLNFESKELFSVDYDDIGFMTKLEKSISGIVPIIGGREGDNNNYPFALTISKNQKYFAISFDEYSKRKESFRFYLINSGLEIVFKKILNLPQKDKNYFFYDFEIDENTESIFFLGKKYQKGTWGGFKMPTYEYELHRISLDQDDHIKIERDKLKINDLSLHINEQNNWVSCLGLYSEQSDFSIEGIVYFSYDRIGYQPIFSQLSKFTAQFKNDTKRRKEKYYNLYIDKIIENEKGELFVLGEERKIIEAQERFGNGAFPTTIYYSDIILAKLGLEGNLLWSRAINKNQEATRASDSYFMSYAGYLKNKNSINVIFNASEKIAKLKDGSELFNFTSYNKIVPYQFTFDKLGKFTYQQLLDSEEKVILGINSCYYQNFINASELFFLGKRINKEQWHKFIIN